MKITSLILLASTFSTIGFNASAQVTVSSFEKSLPAPDISEAKENSLTPQTLDANSLADKLEAAGWDVQRDKHGNLIITRSTYADAEASVEAANSSPWQDIENQLQQSGWSTRQDVDGSLILFPPAAPVFATADTTTATTAVPADSFESMQQKLRDSGWQVTNAADGSVLLYPPELKTSSKPRPCPGIPQTADIPMPVDSWQKAHSIAINWLENQTGFPASIGRIRKILNIYIVSVVAKQAPHTLLQQIAIRSSDGAIIVLN